MSSTPSASPGGGDGAGMSPGSGSAQDNPRRAPAGYIAGPSLRAAVEVARDLDMPLLVAGPPGTGKTDLAGWVAHTVGCPLLRFDTKSTSQAQDLFYTFEQVRHFASSQLAALSGQPLPSATEFVRFQALGLAILGTYPPATLARDIGKAAQQVQHGRSVVLIDEIDKAPRDFPNDLLDRIQDWTFIVPELGVQFTAKTPPIVIITSNSEKPLPEAFLRRCVYHYIEPPDPEALDTILQSRLKELPLSSAAYREAVDYFFRLRGDGALSREPSTSELIDWLRVLAHRGFAADRSLAEQRGLVEECIGSLLKTGEDIRRGKEVLADHPAARST